MKKQRYGEIDYAKGIGILLVVLGHSFPDASSAEGISVPILSIIHDTVYTFHMPLMFFLSGFLSYDLLDKRDVVFDRKKYICSRFKRLMIPYFSVAMVYLPFKILLSEFANNPYDLRKIWQIFLGENPNGGLWYLYVLFIIQVCMSLFITKKNLLFITSVSVLGSLVILTSGYSFFRVEDAAYYFSFACLGLIVYVYYKNFVELVRKKSFFVLITLILGSSLIAYMSFGLIISKYLCAISAIGLIMYIAEAREISLTMQKENDSKHFVMQRLSKYSMDIYIFHGIIMVATRIFMLSILKTNYYLCCIAMFVSGLFISILISKFVVRRVSVLRKLFLGTKT